MTTICHQKSGRIAVLELVERTDYVRFDKKPQPDRNGLYDQNLSKYVWRDFDLKPYSLKLKLKFIAEDYFQIVHKIFENLS